MFVENELMKDNKVKNMGSSISVCLTGWQVFEVSISLLLTDIQSPYTIYKPIPTCHAKSVHYVFFHIYHCSFFFGVADALLSQSPDVAQCFKGVQDIVGR